MKIIGLTGSVGSGKSTVAAVMKEHFQARTLIADTIGHQFMKQGAEGYQKIIEHFGTDILTDGEIDRKKLAQCSFGKQDEITFLNKVIHPLVNHYIKEQINQAKKEQVSVLVIESAILIEAGYEKICDEIWYITADDTIRRKRLKESRGYTDEKIDAILKNQLAEQEAKKYCKYVIFNNSTPEKIKEQVAVLL